MGGSGITPPDAKPFARIAPVQIHIAVFVRGGDFLALSSGCACPSGLRRPRPAEGTARRSPARTKTGGPRGDVPALRRIFAY